MIGTLEQRMGFLCDSGAILLIHWSDIAISRRMAHTCCRSNDADSFIILSYFITLWAFYIYTVFDFPSKLKFKLEHNIILKIIRYAYSLLGSLSLTHLTPSRCHSSFTDFTVTTSTCISIT